MALTKPREIMDPTPGYMPVPPPPPGGLLASAVGDPLNPLPPINPDTYEDDDVVKQLNAITAADSGYMQLARTSGLQTANKRGLLNSSMAAGASQAAAIAAAAPLAAQNAQQIAQRNMERLGSHFAGERQAAEIANREKMLADQIASEEARLGRQLTSAELQQQREIAARTELQTRDITSQQYMQQQQLGAARQLAEMNIAAESERLGRQLTAAEEQQIRELASREAMFATETASREALTREGYAGELARANLDAATRIQLTEIQNLNEDQRAALQFYLQSNQIYAHSLDQLYANKDMPAPARDAAIQNFLALRNSTANLTSILFGTSLSWPTTGGTTTPTTGAAPAPAPIGSGGTTTTTPTNYNLDYGFAGSGLLDRLRYGSVMQ